MQFHRNDFPISIAEALGDRLKRVRLNKNLTQNEVAQLAWIDPSQNNGQHVPLKIT